MSAWSGLRPLVRDPNKTDTKSLARNHIIEVAPSGLVTIAGGFIGNIIPTVLCSRLETTKSILSFRQFEEFTDPISTT
jgi:hypothetical protein